MYMYFRCDTVVIRKISSHIICALDDQVQSLFLVATAAVSVVYTAAVHAWNLYAEDGLTAPYAGRDGPGRPRAARKSGPSIAR